MDRWGQIQTRVVLLKVIRWAYYGTRVVTLDLFNLDECRTAPELKFARGHYWSPMSIKVRLTILCFSGTAFLAGRG